MYFAREFSNLTATLRRNALLEHNLHQILTRRMIDVENRVRKVKT